MTDTSPTQPSQLTRLQRDAIESIYWAMNNFGSLVTNRALPRSRVLRLVELGLVKSIGDVVMCDDDGFTIQPERYREGFRLTSEGLKIHAKIVSAKGLIDG